MIYRFDAPLFFANVKSFRDEITAVARRDPPPQWIVVAAEPITDVDTTAADVLFDLDRLLDERGQALVFAELKDPVRRKIERYGLAREIEPQHFFPTVGAAVDAFRAQTRCDLVRRAREPRPPPPRGRPPGTRHPGDDVSRPGSVTPAVALARGTPGRGVRLPHRARPADRPRAPTAPPSPAGPRGSYTRPVPGQSHAQRARTDRAPHRGRQPDRLPVDADRDLGHVRGDHDLGRLGEPQPLPVRAVEQADGLPGGVHPDGDHPEHPAVQPRPPPHPGEVGRLVRVVADQQRLGASTRPSPDLGDQVRPASTASRSGSVSSVVPRLSSR